jgi:lipase
VRTSALFREEPVTCKHTPRILVPPTPCQAAVTIVGVTADLHVYRYGPDEPIRVLAIHGLTGHGKRWETLATRCLADVAVATPDLIGPGRSSWDAPWTIDAADGARGPVVSST